MRLSRSAVACGVVVSICSLSTAAVITQTENFSGTPGFQRTLNFDQFDDGGGSLTLQSIKVTVTLNVSGGQLILDNDGESTASGTFEFGGKADISSTDVSLLDGSSQPVTDELKAAHSQAFSLDANVGDGSGDYDPSSPDGLQYDGGSESDTDFGNIGSAVWGSGTEGFLGSGAYDITLDASQWQDYGAIGGIEFAVTPVSSSGSVEIVYTYIPEPVTMLLLSAGFIPALLRRRRK